MTAQATNWSGNITFSARAVHRPITLDEMQTIVSRSERLRALGTGHSFNRIADTTGDLVSLAELPGAAEVDEHNGTVTVGAGLRYGEVTGVLQASGRALPNLGSLPHISVAGACATGTHGSGDANRVLAAAVSALDVVTASGDVVTLRRGDDKEFGGAVIALGSLGIVTSLTLDTVEAFEVAQFVYEDMPEESLLDNFEAVFAAAYSVSAFTDWTSRRFKQVWLKSSEPSPDRPPEWLGATLASEPRNPVPGMSPVHCTEQLGVPGPWHERLPHFRLAFTPSSGEELQSEYLLPRDQATDALRALGAIRDAIGSVLQVSEIRTVAADDLWVSPFYGRETVAFHFTWVKDAEAVTPVVAAIEDTLRQFDVRPHWGKVFSMQPPAIAAQYPRFEDFQELVRTLDPDGKFRNDFVDRYLFGDA